MTMDSTVSGRTVVIAMLTYQRLNTLPVILPLLLEQASSVDAAVDIVVVDNDPAGTARTVVTHYAATTSITLRYEHEPLPGIAAARNRALQAAAPYDALVFIDDDELPSPRWLALLLDHWTRWGCAAVTGPVVPDFQVPPPPWVAATGVFDRKRRITGTEVAGAATNNLLLDMAVVNRLALTFDERLGLTGGEDTLFTHQLIASGEVIRWCDEAEVTDPVPADRVSRRWVLRRTFRAGTSWSRMELELGGSGARSVRIRADLIARATANISVSGIHFAWALVRRDIAGQARSATRAVSYAGMLTGALGATLSEYRRLKN